MSQVYFVSQIVIYRISRRKFQFTDFASQVQFTKFRVADFNLPSSCRNFQFTEFRVADFNLPSSRRKFQFTGFHVAGYNLPSSRRKFQFTGVSVADLYLTEFASHVQSTDFASQVSIYRSPTFHSPDFVSQRVRVASSITFFEEKNHIIFSLKHKIVKIL